MAVVKRMRNGKVRWFARWWANRREYWQAAPSREIASKLAHKRSVDAFEGRESPGKRRRCTVTVKAQNADYIAAVRREKAAATADAYAYHAKHIENAPLGKLLIAEVHDLDIAAYRKRASERSIPRRTPRYRGRAARRVGGTNLPASPLGDRSGIAFSAGTGSPSSQVA